jgi:hypothetical protein
VSAALAVTIETAKGALKAAKYADAIAKLKAAEANPQNTAYDGHIINELATVAYVRTNNYPDAGKALDAQLNDGLLEKAEVPARIKAVAQINYHIKNYDKAIQGLFREANREPADVGAGRAEVLFSTRLEFLYQIAR